MSDARLKAATWLLWDATQSDAQLAKFAGCSSNTIRRVRVELESAGRIHRRTTDWAASKSRLVPSDREWRSVDSWAPRYEVSDHGEVRNVQTGMVLKPRVHVTLGYVMYDLHLNGRRENCYAHRMVATAFLGPSDMPLVRHLDDVKTNNHFSNLAYGDHRDNALDAIRNGLMRGKAH